MGCTAYFSALSEAKRNEGSSNSLHDLGIHQYEKRLVHGIMKRKCG